MRLLIKQLLRRYLNFIQYFYRELEFIHSKYTAYRETSLNKDLSLQT